MARHKKIIIEQSAFVPAPAVEAVNMLNKIASAEVEILPPQKGGDSGFVVSEENAKLGIPIRFEAPVADLSGGATLAQVIAKLNEVLERLRVAKINPR